MIGNPKWFRIRKYSGWGLTPICWQGWLYVFIFILPVAIINSITVNQELKNIITIIWTGFLLVDVIHIMSQIKKDEREKIHEAIADRNALWFMIFALLVWVFIKQGIVDPIFIITIIGAMVVKSITYFYLRDK